ADAGRPRRETVTKWPRLFPNLRIAEAVHVLVAGLLPHADDDSAGDERVGQVLQPGERNRRERVEFKFLVHVLAAHAVDRLPATVATVEQPPQRLRVRVALGAVPPDRVGLVLQYGALQPRDPAIQDR